MYEVDDSAVAETVAALPGALLSPYLELREALAVAPDEIGLPLSSENPDGMRTAAIGAGRGLIVYFGKWAEPQRVVVIYAIIF